MTTPIQLLLPFPYSLAPHPINPAMMVAGATQWVFQRLTTLIRPLRASSGLGAFAFPPEIILMITSYLNNSSITSLALTCRTLHWLCFPEHPFLDMVEKKELLLLLEKDVATLYFCHDCVKLHRWHGRWSRSISPWDGERIPCKRGLDNCLFFSTCCIPYYYARLVMNRHFYGPTHGPPPHKLEERAHSYYHQNGVVISMSRHARVIDDQLLVLSVESMSHSQGDSTSLRSHIDSFGHIVCEHLTLAEGWPDRAPIQLPELAKDETTPSLFLTCDQAFGSCTFCLTDYSINISWQGERKGYAIEVSIHRQLGDCRSPFNWSWHTMSTLQTEEEPRTAYPLEYGPGCVRDRWNKADGIASRAQGEWVRNSGLVAKKSRVSSIR
jgi:hypothetical protein